jgi:biotin carboxylase
MTIFILGAGVMQLPAIQIAKDLGWTVAAADANAAAVGADRVDRFIHVDLKDLAGLEAAARELRASIGLDGVFTAGTDFSASVAWVAERLGLPGIPYQTALRATNKLAMRAALAAAGVPSPRFVEAAAGSDAVAAARGLGFPLVVKPADSMGARGCRSVRDAAQLERAVADALPYSRSGKVIIEAYVDGPEFSIDAIVVDGDIRIRGLADRHIAFAPYFVEIGHTMPTAYPPEVAEEVLRVFKAGVRAIGISSGAAKGDIKYSPGLGTAVVGEIAARLSGGYMSGWTYPYASGIEVTREAIEAAVGLVPAPPRPDRGWVSAERAFLSIPGRLAAILGTREAERTPYVKDLFYRAVPGDRLVFPSNNVEKLGNVLTQAPDRGSAVDAAMAAVRAIVPRLMPADGDTEAFLRGTWPEAAGESLGPDGAAWPPDAFVPESRAQAGLAALPEYLRRGEGGSVSVLPFEYAGEVGGMDWAGRGFADSAQTALAIGRVRLGDGGDTVLAGRFWRALARGGLQAALYAIDSARGGGA